MPYVATGKFTEQDEVIGNGQCATLVKALTGAPAASLWRAGENISNILENGGRLPTGTAIATFVDGRYPNWNYGNYAAIFLRPIGNGIEVFDQFVGGKPKKRVIRFGSHSATNRVRRAESYFVIL